MSYINNSMKSVEGNNSEKYRLIIPKELVTFKEVYSSVLKKKKLEVDVDEVGDVLNFDSINRMSVFDIVGDIENKKKLLDKANIVESVARNIMSICNDDKLNDAVCVLKEIVDILINYKGIEGNIYIFEVVMGYLREASLREIYSSSFIEKLERSLNEGKYKNGVEEVLVSIRVKEVVIEKMCCRKVSSVYRPWIEDLIYPLKEEVVERIDKCRKVGIRYNYESREMYKMIENKYERNMLEKCGNKEYSEGFVKQLPDKNAFCGTEKTVYKATRVISRILRPIIKEGEGKEVIFPWLELIDYIEKSIDKRKESEDFSQEYLSE